MLVGISIVQKVISNYAEPSLPHYLALVLSAGPTEESLFFGIPYYAFGNHYLVLAGGIIWAMLHILNTHALDIHNLAYANWLFVIPSFFFSFRTWISGKGWFAILFHSSWNAAFLVSYCLVEKNNCVLIGNGEYFLLDLLSIISAALLLIATYRVYQYKRPG